VVTQLVLHAPKLPSQIYGAQSKVALLSVAQLPPAAEHTEMPVPWVASVHALGAHSTPATAGTQLPAPLHVWLHVPFAPHADFGSVP